MTDDETLALADRMFRAIEAGDLDAVRQTYDPDIVVWANFEDRSQDLERSLRVLGWLCDKLTDRRYDVKRRDVIPGGFLQEHVLRGTAPDGSAVAMPACIVATVDAGRITRIHEYLDPAGVRALSA
jgi:ketosteroid isomerase-like protein